MIDNIKFILENFKGKDALDEIAKEIIAEEIQTLGVTFEDLGLTIDQLDNPKYMHHTDEYETEEFQKKPKKPKKKKKKKKKVPKGVQPKKYDKNITNLYRYVSHPSSGYGASHIGKFTRGFCRKVVSRTNVALMRYVDILKLNGSNPGFGQGGSNIYSVFKYRGGVNCKHIWVKYKYNKETRELIEATKGEQPKQIGAGSVPNA